MLNTRHYSQVVNKVTMIIDTKILFTVFWNILLLNSVCRKEGCNAKYVIKEKTVKNQYLNTKVELIKTALKKLKLFFFFTFLSYERRHQTYTYIQASYNRLKTER